MYLSTQTRSVSTYALWKALVDVAHQLRMSFSTAVSGRDGMGLSPPAHVVPGLVLRAIGRDGQRRHAHWCSGRWVVTLVQAPGRHGDDLNLTGRDGERHVLGHRQILHA